MVGGDRRERSWVTGDEAELCRGVAECVGFVYSFSSLFALPCFDPFVRLLNLRISCGVLDGRGDWRKVERERKGGRRKKRSSKVEGWKENE